MKVGDIAPDFSLPDQDGNIITRSNFKSPLIVFFYPADSTTGCSLEAKAFNKAVSTLREKYDAEVVGISSQDIQSKKTFACSLDLKYPILADVHDEARIAFQVPRGGFGLFPGRVTYVLDSTGKCIHIYENLLGAESHVDKALEALESLKKK